MWYFFGFSLILIALIFLLFFFVSKSWKWLMTSSSTFECGFSSYFFSRFSFSIHYYLVALIFLLLDLEICLIFPFLTGFFDNFHLNTFLHILLVSLLLGLFYEWLEGNLSWKF